MYKSMVYTQLFKGEHIVVSGSMSAYFFFLFLWAGICNTIVCSIFGGGVTSHNIGYKFTILCPYITLVCYFVPPPSFLTSRHSRDIPSSSSIVSSPSDSTVSAAALFFTTSKSRLACSQHHLNNLAPVLREDRSQRSRIGRVAIYYATVFYLLVLYFLIPFNPDSNSAFSNDD